MVARLLDPREDEDVVVHREPEQDREDEDRHERLDRTGLEPEQLGAVAVLEDEHEQAEGRAGREQVEQDRLDRDDDRAEGDEQEQEREAEDEGDDLRHAVRVEVDDVERASRGAGHERLDPGQRPEDGRDDIAPDVADDLPVALVVRATGHHHRDQRGRPVGVGLDGRRLAQPLDRQQPRLEVPMAVWVAASFALVTTTSSVAVEPLGHRSLSRFTPWTASIESGTRRSRTGPGAGAAPGRPSPGGPRQPARTAMTGRAITARTTTAQRPLPSGRSRPRYGIRSRFTPSPRIASVAGRNVSDPMTAMSTTEIVPTAIDRNRTSSSRNRPPIENMTARPEKKTARPAVAERRGSHRLRPPVPPLGPVARDHEQRVVDGHRQPDQHDQLARIGADGRDVLAVEPEDAERGQQRRDRQHEGDHGGHDRPERDQQDPERDRDRQPQGRVETAVDEFLDLPIGDGPIESVDGQPRVIETELVEEAGQRVEPLVEHGVLAGDAGRQADGGPVR